jgi:hypothetical protein
MAAAIYELIGRVVVRFVRVRYRRQIRTAVGVGCVGLAAAAYVLATREPPEG